MNYCLWILICDKIASWKNIGLNSFFGNVASTGLPLFLFGTVKTVKTDEKRTCAD